MAPPNMQRPPIAPPYVLERNRIRQRPAVVGNINHATGAPIQANPDNPESLIPSIQNATYSEYEIATGDGLVLPANPRRVSFFFINTGLATVYISLSGLQPPFTKGMPIAPNGYWSPEVAPKNTISISGGGYAAEAIV